MRCLRIFSFILYILLTTNIQAQNKKLNKVFNKSLKYLDKQKFYKAIKTENSAVKKVDSLKWTDLEYAKFYSLKAYTQLQIGNGDLVKSLLNTATQKFLKLNESINPDEVAIIKNGILNTALASGFYKEVEEIIENRPFDANRYNLAFPIGQSNEIARFKILVNQGFLFNSENTLMQLAKAQLDIETALADKAFSKSITDDDQKEIENNFARLGLLRLQILNQSGDLENAIEVGLALKKEFDRVIGKGTTWEGRLYRQMKELYVITGDKKEALKYGEQSLKFLEKQLASYHYEVLYEKLDLTKLYFDLNKALPAERFGAQIQKDVDYYKKYSKSNNTVAKYIVSFEKNRYAGDFRSAKAQANSMLSFVSGNFDVTTPVIEEINYMRKYFLTIGDFDASINAAERFAQAREAYYFSDAPAKQEGEIDLALLKLKYLYTPADESLASDEQLNSIAKRFGKQHPLYIKSLELSFFQALFLNNLTKADLYGKEIITLKERIAGKYNQIYLESLYNLGKLYVISGKIQELQDLITEFKAVENDTKRFDKDGRNSIYLGYLEGSLNELLGDYDAAQKEFSKAFRKLDRSDKKQKFFVNIEPEVRASVNLFLGKLDDAEDILLNAKDKKSARYGDDAYPLIGTYLSLSKLRLQQGNLPEAKKMVSKAQNILRDKSDGNNIQLLQAMELQANLDIILGDRELAFSALDELHKRESEVYGDQHFKPAITNIKRSWMAFFLGSDVDSELNTVNNSLEIIQNTLGKQHPDYAFGTWMKAALLLEKKEYQLALNFADTALSIYEEIDPYHEMIIRIGSLKGDVYYSWNKIPEAEKEYSITERKASRLYGETHPSLADIRFKVATSKIANGENKGVRELEDAIFSREYFLQKDFPFLTQREKQKYYAGISKELQYYPFVKITIDDGNKSLEELVTHRMKTKGVLLKSKTDFESIILKSGNEAMIQKLNEWRVAQNEYTNVLMGGETTADDKDNLEVLLRNAERLENEILQTVSNEKKSDDPDCGDLQKSLTKEETVVEIIRAINEKFEPYYYALLINRKDVKVVEMPDAVNLELKNYRYMQRSLEFETPDNKSYALFWESIGEAINEDCNVVYFSPDGIYHLINPEMLKPKGDSLYLLDKYKMVRVSNPRDVIALKNQKESIGRNLSSMVIGNPKFSTTKTSSVEQLAGAAIEAQNLSASMDVKGWKTTLLSDERATEDTLMKADNPNVLHIATHGFFKDSKSNIDSDLGIRSLSGGNNPLINSGLLLANGGESYRDDAPINGTDEGIFTALEAQNLNLSQCELVVLSACETGQGSVSVGNGVFGLQKSFLDAGAGSLMMTLQKVNDEVTQKLMDNFYAAYLDGDKPEDALYKAKLAIKKEYPHPHYWAPFILVK